MYDISDTSKDWSVLIPEQDGNYYLANGMTFNEVLEGVFKYATCSSREKAEVIEDIKQHCKDTGRYTVLVAVPGGYDEFNLVHRTFVNEWKESLTQEELDSLKVTPTQQKQEIDAYLDDFDRVKQTHLNKLERLQERGLL